MKILVSWFFFTLYMIGTVVAGLHIYKVIEHSVPLFAFKRRMQAATLVNCVSTTEFKLQQIFKQ